MPDKNGDRIRLRHVLEAIETIEGYVSYVDYSKFMENTMLRDACIRQLQVVGESCRNVSEELRGKYPEIPWRQIVG